MRWVDDFSAGPLNRWGSGEPTHFGPGKLAAIHGSFERGKIEVLENPTDDHPDAFWRREYGAKIRPYRSTQRDNKGIPTAAGCQTKRRVAAFAMKRTTRPANSQNRHGR